MAPNSPQFPPSLKIKTGAGHARERLMPELMTRAEMLNGEVLNRTKAVRFTEIVSHWTIEDQGGRWLPLDTLLGVVWPRHLLGYLSDSEVSASIIGPSSRGLG